MLVENYTDYRHWRPNGGAQEEMLKSNIKWKNRNPYYIFLFFFYYEHWSAFKIASTGNKNTCLQPILFHILNSYLWIIRNTQNKNSLVDFYQDKKKSWHRVWPAYCHFFLFVIRLSVRSCFMRECCKLSANKSCCSLFRIIKTILWVKHSCLISPTLTSQPAQVQSHTHTHLHAHTHTHTYTSSWSLIRSWIALYSGQEICPQSHICLLF